MLAMEERSTASFLRTWATRMVYESPSYHVGWEDGPELGFYWGVNRGMIQTSFPQRTGFEFELYLYWSPKCVISIGYNMIHKVYFRIRKDPLAVDT